MAVDEVVEFSCWFDVCSEVFEGILFKETVEDTLLSEAAESTGVEEFEDKLLLLLVEFSSIEWKLKSLLLLLDALILIKLT